MARASKTAGKGNSGAMLVGGVALVLVLVGGGVVAWQLSQTGGAKQAAAKIEKKADDTKPAISDAELDAILGPVAPPEPSKPAEPPVIAAADTSASPSAPAPGVATTTAAQEPSPAKLTPTDPKIEAAKKLIAAQPRWTPVEGVVIRGRDIQVEVAQVWLAKDEQGTRVDPILPTAGTGPDGKALAVAPQATVQSPGKFIFVDVRVSNTGAIPRKYTSWNAPGATMAILAQANNEPLSLVAAADTPEVERLTTLHIPAGQTVGDVLVFRAPAQPFELLKLLLPQSAFAAGGRSFALEVPVEFLFKRAEALPPQTALAADESAPAGEGAAKPAKPVDPNTPPSLEDFTKSLEDDKKMLDKRNATDDASPKPKSDS